jgi:DNA-directed RNA polymerase subunit omega
MEHVFAIDCQPHVPNPFVVVHLAARRARQLRQGDQPRIAVRSTNPALMAIEEIAGGAVAVDELFTPPQLSGPDDDHPHSGANDELKLLAGMSQQPRAEVPSYAGKEN